MRIESMKDWADALKESGKAIIVEGKKDVAALESLGLSGFYTLSKTPVFAVIEAVADRHKKAVILTDFDAEGRKLYGRISSGLQDHGVEVDNVFREWLQRHTKVRQIEGLSPDTEIMH
jgi:5S rRNA maturation endonuclease (ribonuclease M5)